MNVVRLKVKTEHKDGFIKATSKAKYHELQLSFKMIQTGDNQFCGIGEWESEEALVSARPNMIKFLDTIRHMLEEISPELGVTDPVSGPIVYQTN